MSTVSDSVQQTSGAIEARNECADWQALLECIPYAQHLGLEAQPETEGALVHLPCREALIGNFMLPALHGGVIAALIELTARVAAQHRDNNKRCPRILDSHINYLRPAKARSTFAGAEIVRQGRRTSLIEVVCWQGERAAPIANGRVQLLLPIMAAKKADLNK
ncbi:MAG TPA: PaaI family thioesterase [Marinobacter hydrocarbonoclasticus]|uniref:PaaI family thioesterase n=1 Tax=Alloalcanivorax xenomutans TaxID=1094342 RepID=UPI0007A7533D|nr:PaaI family thioesterase [Alloalcanivorax xenomutans]KYZ85303.1 thioesterase [Alcanivorax sp. KX64203]MAO61026.1 thioesterase [Alcanivorax sp.]HAX09206.1 PaaI family thioesterase [Marinobacter nauticus]MAY11009.1 thioesterase [Alcanivorax sp.]MBI54088.1 thioesterase [Alcanivorax sp.]|tara:strand:- start:78 stop:566 length:489 start_codon:yes stop_codon:yes gene_type:complete